jgi:stage III sporulation protein AF
MNAIVEWVRQIFILSVLSGIIINLMPSSKYEQYAKFICGLLIAVACISPFISFLSKGTSLDEIYDSIVSRQNIQELRSQLSYSINESDQTLVNEYEKTIAEDIDKRVLEAGLYPSKTNVTIDMDTQSKTYGAIQKIDMVVSTTKKSDADINISKVGVDKIVVGQTNSTDQGTKLQNPKIIQLKNDLSNFYNISLSNINISINGD